jgi:hypothetical protein
MKTKIFLLWALALFICTVVGCKEDTVGNYTIAVWACQDTNDYYFGIQISFPLWKDGKKIGYQILMFEKDKEYEPINSEFEINGNIQPFSEWQECNIKFPNDTTKNWLFRYEGENIPQNISFLYDIKNNIGDTLVFWDSISNIKYYFEKHIISLH